MRGAAGGLLGGGEGAGEGSPNPRQACVKMVVALVLVAPFRCIAAEKAILESQVFGMCSMPRARRAILDQVLHEAPRGALPLYRRREGHLGVAGLRDLFHA